MKNRKAELHQLKKFAYLNAGASFTLTYAPFLVSVTTFATYSLIHKNDPENQLTPERAFVALSLFNILRFPLGMLPRVITHIIQVHVCIIVMCTMQHVCAEQMWGSVILCLIAFVCLFVCLFACSIGQCFSEACEYVLEE